MKKTRNVNYYIAGLVSLLTFLVYLKSLNNGFVGLDDTAYIVVNPYIRSFNQTFFKWAFFDFYSLNWHPLTWVSHALDYAIWGLDPLGHHLTNNVLHAVNTFVVVLLTTRLLDAAKEKATHGGPFPFLDERTTLIAAGVTGLLFGLHPLHVESVAWVAERKDLLCALFFLLSLMMYVDYADKASSPFLHGGGHSLKTGGGPITDQSATTAVVKGPGGLFRDAHYLLSFGFFALALLSKPMAVSLPLVLLILDWYPFKRMRSLKTLRAVLPEKVPFIVLSLLSSVVTVLAQESGGNIWKDVPWQARALVATKSLVAYLWNMAAPLNLLPFYPYPLNVSLLSLKYLAMVALVVGITAACLTASKKQKIWLSVWVYYVVTLAPVLGILQAGGQAMADRYTYLPSLGPFLIVGLSVAWVSGSLANGLGRVVKITGKGLAVCVFISMTYLTFQQIGIWKNGLELWTYVIKKEPENILFAYYNRAQTYSKLGRYLEAIEDYSRVIDRNYQEYSRVYIDRGFTYLQIGQREAALADLKKACDLGDSFGCQALQYYEKKGQ